MWYYSKWSQNVRMLSPLKRRNPAYVTLLVKSPFCPQCCKNLPHIVHHIYFWTTTCKHIIALPVFIGKPTSFRNGFNHTLYTKPIKRLLQAKHSGNNQNLSWWSRFKRISIRQNQAWQKRKQITDKSITNKDANKRRFIANNKKGCTQTAYVGSLVTILDGMTQSPRFFQTIVFSPVKHCCCQSTARVVVLTANIWNLAFKHHWKMWKLTAKFFTKISSFSVALEPKFQIPPLCSVMFAIKWN